MRATTYSPADPNTRGAPVEFAFGRVLFKAARVKLLAKVVTLERAEICTGVVATKLVDANITASKRTDANMFVES